MKTEDLSRLKNIFVPGRISIPTKSEWGLAVVLKEQDPSAKLRTVEIVNVPKDTLLISLHDVNPEAWLRGLLESASELGLFKCCDYILLSAHNTIFIELKSQKPDMGEVKKQLKSGTCLFTYCSSVLRQFYDINIPFPGVEGGNTKYILISSKSGEKRKFKDKPKYHNTPEKLFHYRVGNKEEARINYHSLI
jgi:hypothetical protein